MNCEIKIIIFAKPIEVEPDRQKNIKCLKRR